MLALEGKAAIAGGRKTRSERPTRPRFVTVESRWPFGRENAPRRSRMVMMRGGRINVGLQSRPISTTKFQERFERMLTCWSRLEKQRFVRQRKFQRYSICRVPSMKVDQSWDPKVHRPRYLSPSDHRGDCQRGLKYRGIEREL